MSEQDADAENETASADEESDHSAAEQTPDGERPTADDPRERLEEIAAPPAGDIEEILSAITGTDSDDGTEPDQEFVEVLDAAPATAVAEAVVSLRAELAELEATLEEERERADDLESRLKRKQADFQNYKKRQEKRMEEEKQRATEDLVGRLLDVRDNLQRALEQDSDADIRGGVESTLEQFNRELEKENVEVIEPEPGSEVDPRRHEVLATVASDQPADTVADRHRPGYEMAGKVLRPAQVAVSDGSEHEPGDAAEDTDGEDTAGAEDEDDANRE